MERLLEAVRRSSAKLVVLNQVYEGECKQPLVKEHVQSFDAKRRERRLRQNKGYWIEIKEPTHFFLPSVFTCIGVPLRDGPRKRELGLAVSLDFQLSVLAELLRETASFLVIVDQLAQLRDVHKCVRSWAG